MNITSDWRELIETEINQSYFKELVYYVEQDDQHHSVFPPKKQMFRAFNLTSFQNTKVVILGQDPYHGKGQANGLSFSVNQGVPLPPSLKNIYKELTGDIGCHFPEHGDLTNWANQGVLLLNSVLTVREGKAHSHKSFGWETFTDRIISILNDEKNHLVFILWGKHAQTKGQMIDSSRHLVLTSPHPSPLSAHRGFFGSKPFSSANAYLSQHHQTTINWCL